MSSERSRDSESEGEPADEAAISLRNRYRALDPDQQLELARYMAVNRFMAWSLRTAPGVDLKPVHDLLHDALESEDQSRNRFSRYVRAAPPWDMPATVELHTIAGTRYEFWCPNGLGRADIRWLKDQVALRFRCRPADVTIVAGAVVISDGYMKLWNALRPPGRSPLPHLGVVIRQSMPDVIFDWQ